ncbi:hypothetical protein CGSHi3655_08399, partial [Haemophilus influenzae 3655]
ETQNAKKPPPPENEKAVRAENFQVEGKELT